MTSPAWSPECFLQLAPAQQRKALLAHMQQTYAAVVESEGLHDSKDVIPALFSTFDLEQMWQQVVRLSEVCLQRYQEDPGLDDGLGDEEDADMDQDEIVPEQDEGDSDLSDLDLDDHLGSDQEGPSGSDSGSGLELADGGDDLEDSDMDKSDAELDSGAPKRPKFTGRSTEVDDKFFKLSDMEQYLVEEETENPEEKSEKEADLGNYLFAAGESDDEEEPMYADFFDEPYRDDRKKSTKKRVRFSDAQQPEGLSDFEDGEDGPGPSRPDPNEPISSYERVKQRMERVMAEMEEENLAEKSWQMKGEVAAQKRPENSALEEHLDFTAQSRLPPTVTPTFTETIEKMIKQRIKDRIFDDVARKVKPNLDPSQYKNELVLDQQKSKVSLSQIYEQEWLKQTQDGEAPEKRNPKHVEIENLMKELFVKLDALSHHNFTPVQPRPEITVVKNAPAISMEEVAPTILSEGALLAPEDVKSRPKGDVKTDKELTESDRKHKRRLKKKVKKLQNERIDKKTRRKNVDDLKKIGKVKKVQKSADLKLVSSRDFFGRLDQGVGKPKKLKNTVRSAAEYKN